MVKMWLKYKSAGGKDVVIYRLSMVYISMAGGDYIKK